MATSIQNSIQRPKILLVDDMDDFRMTMKWFLTSHDYAVDSASSAEEAISLFRPEVHQLVMTDNSMPGMTGAELAQILKRLSPSTPILMHTGSPPTDQTFLDVVIQKPARLFVLKAAIDKLLS